jgi:phospholipid/cholesterol/gamma-HCH transport system substrate-binding protein
MSNQTMKVQIGLLVLGGFLLLGTLVIMFGSIPGLFKSVNQYQVSFNDAPGISAGAPVRRSGVRIGQVSHITLDDKNGQVIVNLTIERSYKIRKYEQPTLVTGLLGNDSSIDLIPKDDDMIDPNREEVALGTTIEGVRAANVASLLNRASDIVPSTQETLNEMSKSIQKLEKIAPKVEEALKEFTNTAKKIQDVVPEVKKTLDEYSAVARQYNRIGERVDLLIQANQDKIVKIIEVAADDLNKLGNILNDENQKQVSSILKNVRKGTEDIDQLAKNTDEMMKELKTLVKKVNDQFSVVEEMINDISVLIKPFANRSESLAKNIDEIFEKSVFTISDIRELVRVIGQADGTIKRFLTDPGIYNNLDNAIGAVTRMTPKIERVLKDVEIFTDKIARHPESIGLGGVVRPGSGLKDNPPSANPLILSPNR